MELIEKIRKGEIIIQNNLNRDQDINDLVKLLELVWPKATALYIAKYGTKELRRLKFIYPHSLWNFPDLKPNDSWSAFNGESHLEHPVIRDSKPMYLSHINLKVAYHKLKEKHNLK